MNHFRVGTAPATSGGFGFNAPVGMACEIPDAPGEISA